MFPISLLSILTGSSRNVFPVQQAPSVDVDCLDLVRWHKLGKAYKQKQSTDHKTVPSFTQAVAMQLEEVGLVQMLLSWILSASVIQFCILPIIILLLQNHVRVILLSNFR